MPLFALQSVLQAWLREQLPLPADVGDISFDSPNAGWGTGLTRPTVNLFLFDIARAAQPPLPMPPRRDAGGGLVRDRPAPWVTCSYLLSTWAADVRQEHRLLGDAMRAVLGTSALSPPAESEELASPIQIGLCEANEVQAGELWSGLGVPLRAAMVLVATAAVPLGRPRALAPPVQTVLAEVTAGVSEVPAGVAPGPATVTVEGSVLEHRTPRRFVWFGPRQQRGRGRP